VHSHSDAVAAAIDACADGDSREISTPVDGDAPAPAPVTDEAIGSDFAFDLGPNVDVLRFLVAGLSLSSVLVTDVVAAGDVASSVRGSDSSSVSSSLAMAASAPFDLECLRFLDFEATARTASGTCVRVDTDTDAAGCANFAFDFVSGSDFGFAAIESVIAGSALMVTAVEICASATATFAVSDSD
jgi:hypothetical protein